MNDLLTGSVNTIDTGNAIWGFIVAGTLLMLIGIVLYILYGIGMSTIARNEGFDKPWLAWIPILNLLLIPALTEDDVDASMQGRFTLIYGVALVVCVVVGPFIPFVGMIPTLLTFYGFYFIADRYSDNPGIHMVVLILTGAASIPVQVFRFRHRESLY